MFKTNLKSLSLLFFLTVDWRKLFDLVSLISQYDINVSKLNLQIYIQRKKKKKKLQYPYQFTSSLPFTKYNFYAYTLIDWSFFNDLWRMLSVILKGSL